jgi:hypothetical protein
MLCRRCRLDKGSSEPQPIGERPQGELGWSEVDYGTIVFWFQAANC